MAITFYGDLDEAADLAGVETSSLTKAMQDSINEFINLITIPEGFRESNEITEYIDIDDSNVTRIMLEHYPIISGSLTLIDNNNSSSRITVNEDCYRVDNESGMIQLLPVENATSTDITFFTKGVQSVKVTYKMGYASVPESIKVVATLLLAKWGKINNQQTDADGRISVRMGDFAEKYDLAFMNIKSEFDDKLKVMIDRIQAKYCRV